MYQLWLDDLYPRAKFADGLALIEKLGHTKRMQTMRREWINEGKPRDALDYLGEGAKTQAGERTSSISGQDQSSEVKSRERARTPVAVVEDVDLYSATPKTAHGDVTSVRNDNTDNFFVEDLTKSVPILGQNADDLPREENFDDDQDALLALNEVW